MRLLRHRYGQSSRDDLIDFEQASLVALQCFSDVGSDSGSPASPDYGPTGNRFTGEIEWVQLDIGDDSHDHLITPEERFNLAMARQ